ncbi:hypothetical protein M501DRAFT_1001940, partial [Patellaria atrata CBS 101060]
ILRMLEFSSRLHDLGCFHLNSVGFSFCLALAFRRCASRLSDALSLRSISTWWTGSTVVV